MTPSIVSPVVTNRQSAITSLRARATIIVLRVPIRLSTVRVRIPHCERALLLKHQKSATRVGSCRGGPGRCRLWLALVPVAARRSHPANPSGRRSALPLFSHALAVTAPHGPAYQRFRHQHRRFGPAAEPWRGARSQAAAPIVSDELPRSP